MEAFSNLRRVHSVASGCWLEPHSARSEEAWKKFFGQIARHNYPAEVCVAVDKLLDAELVFAGCIGDDGVTLWNKKGSDDAVYYTVTFEHDTPRCTEHRRGERCLPYTPLFILK